MRVLVARCSIGYSGRLTTRLASGDRIIIFKDDGSVCVHGPKGFKPINYMSGPTAITEEDGLITVRRPETGETLMIEVEQVIADDAHGLEDNAVLEREGRELELHALLERAPDLIEEGLEILERERATDVGPVDFLAKDTEGRIVLVEVKRVKAVVAAVEQVVRYREHIEKDAAYAGARAIVLAPEFAPQARKLAERRNVECIVLDVAALYAGTEQDPTLF
ncbi:MAG: endonuclease NucS [Actinobacteria bacterium]|nr:endonuclease NucS [Actinomycetota bacterium]